MTPDGKDDKAWQCRARMFIQGKKDTDEKGDKTGQGKRHNEDGKTVQGQTMSTRMSRAASQCSDGRSDKNGKGRRFLVRQFVASMERRGNVDADG